METGGVRPSTRHPWPVGDAPPRGDRGAGGCASCGPRPRPAPARPCAGAPYATIGAMTLARLAFPAPQWRSNR